MDEGAADAALVVLHLIPSLHVGGVNRALLAALEQLVKGPNRHVLGVLTDYGPMRPEFEALGVEVVSVGHTGFGATPRTVARLRGLLRDTGVDVLHSHLLLPRTYGGLVARLTRVPHVTTVHSTEEEEFVSLESGRCRRAAILTAQRWADEHLVTRFVAVSGAAADLLRRIRPRVGDRIEVIHPGLDVRDFDAPEPATFEAVRLELGLPEGAPLLLNVGRLMPVKNQRALVPMMVELGSRRPDAHLAIVGQGDLTDEIAAAVTDAGLDDRVHLLGLRDDVPALLHLADVAVAPSTLEGFGVFLTEAMAAGTPVVASDIPSFREIATSGHDALLVDPADPVAFAAAVADLLDHPDRAEALADAGRTTVLDRFTSTRTAEQLDELYARLAASA